MEVVDDDGGKSEEDQVIEAEGDFVPRGPWAGDELGEDVLDDQDDPDEGVGVRKVIRTRRGACAPDAPNDEAEAEEEERPGDFREESTPILFFAEIDVGPAFESVPDGKAQAQE